MPGFLNVRVAPGLRLSTSGRGLRAHVGPRAARLHVGGGGAGVSTGTGPFTYYKSMQSLGQQRSTRATSSSDAAQQKAAEAERVQRQLAAIQALHRYEFPAPSRGIAEMPSLPGFSRLLDAAEREYLKGIGVFRRQERREARAHARQATEQHCRLLLARARHDQAQEQSRLDAAWTALLANDEDVVLGALESAFEDNQAPAAALGVDGGTAYVAVLVPGPETLPERLPSTTVAGNLSLKKMTKSQRASWYLPLVAGHAVATAKEALATCPGLVNVTVVALRPEPVGPPLPILATNLARQGLDQVAWAEASSWDVVEGLGRDTRVRFKGVARELTGLDLSDEPSLKSIVDAF